MEGTDKGNEDAERMALVCARLIDALDGTFRFSVFGFRFSVFGLVNILGPKPKHCFTRLHLAQRIVEKQQPFLCSERMRQFYRY